MGRINARSPDHRNSPSISLRIWFLSARAHFGAHWSSPSHFWSGFLGMFVNNCIALGTIWAMLFAGRPELTEQSHAYACTALVNMAGWGVIHLFLGGWIDLGNQIESGSLDSALMTPRSPLTMTSLTQSYLPAWGDLIMGVVGLGALAFLRYGLIFLLHSVLMIALAALAFGGIFLAIGSLAFWARRNDRLSNTLVMMILSFNSYPIFDSIGDPLKWMILLAPLTAVGVIPSRFLLHPTWSSLGAEIVAASGMAWFGVFLFKRGLRRYQSTPAFSGARG